VDCPAHNGLAEVLMDATGVVTTLTIAVVEAVHPLLVTVTV
jgi:hypothetical protein